MEQEETLYDNLITSKCRGSLRELFQDPIFNGKDIEITIVSALSNNFTKTSVNINKKCDLEEIGKTKVKNALINFFNKYGLNYISGEWSFKGNIPLGVGMSSLTSDIVSSLRCISLALNKNLSVKDIIDAIYNVERSDSIFINSPCLYMSQNQKIVDVYKPIKKIYCAYIIENIIIDTASTKDNLINHYRENKIEYEILLKSVQQAFGTSNIDMIIKNSTKSAKLSQIIIPKDNLKYFYSNYKSLNAEVSLLHILAHYLVFYIPENQVKTQ